MPGSESQVLHNDVDLMRSARLLALGERKIVPMFPFKIIGAELVLSFMSLPAHEAANGDMDRTCTALMHNSPVRHNWRYLD